MTQTLKNMTLVLLVAAALGALALALIPNPGTAVAAPAAPVMHRIDAIPAARAVVAPAPAETIRLGTDFGVVTLALGEGVDYTQDQVDEVLASADRVCEGRTAGVPHEVMAQTVAAQSGMAPRQAEAFVSLVLVTRCGA